MVLGGGIVGAVEAYNALRDADLKKDDLRIIICEQNSKVADTTSYSLFPSLTPDEILSVVPRGNELVSRLRTLFSEPSGIRVDDVPGISDSETSKFFISEVERYSADQEGHEQRTKALLELGKESMDLWQKFYDSADPELKKILIESNFNPCREISEEKLALRKGYRIDLIYSIPNAKQRALNMQRDYQALGYKRCALLSPDEVVRLDPYLANFCKQHSQLNSTGEREWSSDTAALFRPGGCIDTRIFLPKFYEYMRKKMGVFVNQRGEKKERFELKFGAKVTSLQFDKNSCGEMIITGISINGERFELDSDRACEFVFCPGESVGTLKQLGLSEPAYARFAGASLTLFVDLPKEKIDQYRDFNHCMEVHQEGVVLAWQARFIENRICIGVAGTKAFYGDKKPTKEEAFARNRNLLQLNMINDVLPDFISIAMNRDTFGKKLTEEDLFFLESRGIAHRWVGTRAVAYDGFPSVGHVYHENCKVINARCTTHLGSGGVSFCHGAAAASRSIFDDSVLPPDLIKRITRFGDSSRSACTTGLH
ncbi:MAG TPA: FAD-dependent oxidoreductase [Candidatus Babeliales bacterium]|nr:FAD-dependent oxidoreductase [Candidatus Babeliales bacterium]